MERGSRALKERTRMFHNFPAKKNPVFKVWLFIKPFTLWCNFVRPRRLLADRPYSHQSYLDIIASGWMDLPL